MTQDILLQTLASGILIGLIYALVAVGLTLIFGVMEITNFSHGEFLMLGMYSAFWMFALWQWDPIVTLPISAIGLFIVGAAIYRLVIKRIIGAAPISQIFTTFGLMILLRGVAQFLWKADYRAIDKSSVSGSISLLGVQLGTPHLAAGVGAVLTTVAVYLFLTKTRAGAALEATAADREAAQLMGIDSQRMFTLSWGIGAACAGVAGALLATFFPIFPEVGANFILIAFVVVNLGGFGSVAGAFWAGLIVGIVEVMGGLLLGPQFKMAVVLALFLAMLIWRPQGLMGKT